MKDKIISVCRLLHQKGYLAAADGNVSFRVDDDRIIVTPSGVAKADLTVDDMAEVRLSGEVISGKPSSELEMHLAVYRQCREAKAVVHAHPPYAIAWSISHPDLDFLPSESMSELILSGGDIPFVPYARPGTPQMAEKIENYLSQYRMLILSRHGALSWGEDLDEAKNGMERLEHAAQVLAIAKQLGGITSLPTEEVEYLRSVRQRLGKKTR